MEIDDNNPYREFADPREPDLLTEAEWTRWQELFDSAWDMLTQRHRGYAEELSAGLRTFVPVRGNQGFAGSSSSAAFGAIALSSKNSAAALADVLIHELQHSKLNALLELVTLRHEGAEHCGYAPWRPDPRPLTGLLHGIYAFVSVVEFFLGGQLFLDDILNKPVQLQAAVPLVHFGQAVSVDLVDDLLQGGRIGHRRREFLRHRSIGMPGEETLRDRFGTEVRARLKQLQRRTRSVWERRSRWR
uniref:aKG-HExxH-type peptide beta-hydroxylase n=1 Tax=Kibdelosporangium aridum TaxID=2030 RepID=UPI001F21B105|nr:HEXXH motif-containing putative peptide modification protein [Kibdelosporangium aridum]